MKLTVTGRKFLPTDTRLLVYKIKGLGQQQKTVPASVNLDQACAELQLQFGKDNLLSASLQYTKEVAE